MKLTEVLGHYYQKYVLNLTEVRGDFPELDWRDCTRYLIGFFMKVFLMQEWRRYDELMKLIKDRDLSAIGTRIWGKFELCDNTGEILRYLEQQIERGHDHYPDESLMECLGDDFGSESEAPDVLVCSGIINDLFIGRRNSVDMYAEYTTDQLYDSSMNWPLVRALPYYRRPYLQGQDPARSNALIWVPLPILRFAFFAKEVARFGRPFEGMRAVAQEQLDTLDFTQIHDEYRLILKKVLELEDTPETRQSLDILSNNLFLGEKPLTQAWVEGPEELPWIR